MCAHGSPAFASDDPAAAVASTRIFFSSFSDMANTSSWLAPCRIIHFGYGASFGYESFLEDGVSTIFVPRIFMVNLSDLLT
jgi:hypothetical protein